MWLTSMMTFILCLSLLQTWDLSEDRELTQASVPGPPASTGRHWECSGEVSVYLGVFARLPGLQMAAALMVEAQHL